MSVIVCGVGVYVCLTENDWVCMCGVYVWCVCVVCMCGVYVCLTENDWVCMRIFLWFSYNFNDFSMIFFGF